LSQKGVIKIKTLVSDPVYRIKDLYTDSELKVEDLGGVIRLIFDPYRIIVIQRDKFIKFLREVLSRLEEAEPSE